MASPHDQAKFETMSEQSSNIDKIEQEIDKCDIAKSSNCAEAKDESSSCEQSKSDSKSFLNPPHIFRVALIGDSCNKKCWLFSKLTNKQSQFDEQSLGRTFHSETIVDKVNNTSITLWDISQNSDIGIVETIKPFGDAFDVILFTIEVSKVANNPIEMVEDVLNIETMKEKPFAIVVLNDRNEDISSLGNKLKHAIGKGSRSKDSHHFILNCQESDNSFEIVTKWINSFLGPKPDLTLPYNQATWQNFRKQGLGSISFPRPSWQISWTDIFKSPSRFFFPLKTVRVLLLALDAPGRTTFLYKLKLGEVVTTIPTIGFNVETVQYKNHDITFWDVGGGDKIRPLWRHYYQNTQAIMFFIDGSDRERFEEAKTELMAIETDLLSENCIILIVVNKQDLPNVMSVEEVKKSLQIDQLRVCQSKQDVEEGEFRRKVDIMGMSGMTGQGVDQALDWIIYNI